MKKSFFLLILAFVIAAPGCSIRPDLEKSEANAPVSARDPRGRSGVSRTVLGTVLSSTGRPPLPARVFKVDDPQNKRGLSEKKIEHSFGVARNETPHEISIGFQQSFDKMKYKAACYDAKSAGRRLYLTFDCGWENGRTEKILNVLKEKKVPAAFFCTLAHVKSSPELVARMINEGHIVGNHSSGHPDFTKISRERMADEILDCENYLRENFGYAPTFFRFPEGSYNESALELVDSMGYSSVFWSCAYSDWDVSKPKGAKRAFDVVTARLHPGAIILLHSVSPDNADALADIVDWARGKGYEFKPLTDYPF